MKRTLSIIISFMMAATVVTFPAGVFAEESISTNESAVIEENTLEVDSTQPQNEEPSEENTENIEVPTETFEETTEEPTETFEETAEASTESTEEPIEADVRPNEASEEAVEESTESFEDELIEEVTPIKSITAGQINPLYEDVIDEADITIPETSDSFRDSTSARADVTYMTTKASAAKSLRDKMEARQGTIKIYYKTTSFDGTDKIFYDIFDIAMAHTGVPTEGDYLNWQYGYWEAALDGYASGSYYYLTLTYYVDYYTTAAQEKTVTTYVNNAIEDLNISKSSGKSQYAKVKAIYDYICSKVKYDYDNLYDDSYTLKHTAYAAIVKKKAVCQGYALLFYRMALATGVDARIVAGYGGDQNGMEAHGWNIVKIGKLYYNLDSTWDAGYEPANYEWFLKADGNGSASYSYDSFDETHIPVAAYNTNIDLDDYVRSTADYEVDANEKVVISSMRAKLSYTRTAYTGYAKKPTVTIPGLTSGTDFDVAYSNNIDIGTATVTITGKGSFSGTIKKYFYIKEDIASKKASATLSNISYTYDGNVKKASVIITGLKEGTDFSVSYKNSAGKTTTSPKNAGTYTIVISGIGGYAGSFNLDKKLTIYRLSIANAKVTVNTSTKYYYNGYYKKPTVTVKLGTKTLKKGTDYKVSYSNNLKPGKGKVTVTGIGNYKSSPASKYFVVRPAAPKTVKLNRYGYDDLKVSWSKVTGASGYYVYYKKSTWDGYKKLGRTTKLSYKKANLTDGAAYTFRIYPYVKIGDSRYLGKYKTSAKVYTLKKMATPKAVKSGTEVKVSWSGINGADGYQVTQYQKKNGKIVKVKSYFTTNKSKLFTAKKGKTFYYRVRAYDKISDGRIYAPYSKYKAYTRK